MHPETQTKPVSYEKLYSEIRDQLEIHQDMIKVVEAIRIWPIIDAKVGTGRSVKAAGVATALFLCGIVMQIFSLFPA
ncbi:hypothetical protein [Mesorhizobium sp.]|uniref:hypothetical protein n=1 Tax=Mesorhizobium sp. TaxID=1871066 RepID=UPI00121B605E|nr:hypothetical protein [Mesorhizobium sp.]TIO10594.1 MAG: hypothetical protein E5X88_02055 [Mesorhizobium sp.]TIO35462.1 MAG: hypothetical protein E5X89_09505 [Mesorhizobium sp.]TIP08077.1 MAG: hypothetical protein E5X73_33970 [Mesorhizobium sp.]